MLIFQKAEVNDSATIAQLINSAYRGESSRKGWTTEADLLEGLRTTTADVAKIIKREDAFMLIGTHNNEIVATDRKSTRLNSSHPRLSRMPSSA